jgi:hypothetical protein
LWIVHPFTTNFIPLEGSEAITRLGIALLCYVLTESLTWNIMISRNIKKGHYIDSAAVTILSLMESFNLELHFIASNRKIICTFADAKLKKMANIKNLKKTSTTF